MRCSNCGAESSSKFCPNCGAELNSPFKPMNSSQLQESKPTETQPFLQQSYSQPVNATSSSSQSTSNQVNYYTRGSNSSYTPPQPTKNSTLSVISFIISFFCCFGVVGAILGIVDLVKAKNEPVKQKHGLSIAAIIIGIVIPLICFAAFGNGNDRKKNDDSDSQVADTTAIEVTDEVEDTDAVSTESVETTPIATTPELPFSVSSSTTNMGLGEIANNGNYYVGLACVRSLNRVQTAISSYSEDVSSNQEVIYPIIQVYNNTNSMKTFWDSGISVYADSVQGSDPDTIYLVGVDGIEELNSYSIDPGETAVVITAFVVDKGWSELTIFLDNISWTITPDDVSSTPYTYSCLFGENLLTSTDINSVVYSDEYEITYDGFELYTYSNMITGDETFAVFEFTINNTTDSSLDYDLVGYEMRGYCNSRLLDDATYIMDDTINGYSNVYDVESIHAGMTSRIYVAFPILSGETGTFECFYDTGYINNETIAHVVAVS